MADAKFTPGPWEYDRNIGVIYGTPRWGTLAQTGIGGEFQGAETNAIYEVCTVKSVRVYDFTMSGSGTHYPADPKVIAYFNEQCKANANLIASAPEMYKALKAMVSDDAFEELCQSIGEQPEWLKAAHAALAKADGKKEATK